MREQEEGWKTSGVARLEQVEWGLLNEIFMYARDIGGHVHGMLIEFRRM